MSQKSVNKSKKTSLLKRIRGRGVARDAEPQKRVWWAMVALPVWVACTFVVSSFVVSFVLWFLQTTLGIELSRLGSPAVVETTGAVLIYACTIALTIGIPYALRQYKTTLKELGLDRLTTWTDIGLAPLAFIAYTILYTLLSGVISQYLPFFAPDQAQDVGFKNLTNQMGYMMAFFTLVVCAPLAEEILFRGYLYGKLRRYVPLWVAMLITSLLFAVFHGQWNVGIDVFVLSMVACGLRELTGSIWAGVLLHMIKNVIAFYLLFLAPVLAL